MGSCSPISSCLWVRSVMQIHHTYQQESPLICRSCHLRSFSTTSLPYLTCLAVGSHQLLIFWHLASRCLLLCGCMTPASVRRTLCAGPRQQCESATNPGCARRRRSRRSVRACRLGRCEILLCLRPLLITFLQPVCVAFTIYNASHTISCLCSGNKTTCTPTPSVVC